jgi:hypothetical protein
MMHGDRSLHGQPMGYEWVTNLLTGCGNKRIVQDNIIAADACGKFPAEVR